MSDTEEAVEAAEPIEAASEAAEPIEVVVETAEAPVCLTYVGGGRYVIGVPTRDLCGVAVEEAERLIETGLYARADCATGAEAPSGE